ncbi:COBRA plant [Arabidopsis thaliana x Arabidopsis arenosa]|nr:COBRA plant [Arabidopsis thaliana x Arabidopsis arenosa]CAD5322586.1 unnamed protein product [Arabidopsis thaliana]
MSSAYSTAKLLFLLLLVEASLGRYLPIIPGLDCKESLLRFCNSVTIQACFGTPNYWFPDGNVTIRWDIMNETRGGYTANVTIFNYLKYHDIEGPWVLDWIWEDQILLSTVGVQSSNFTIYPDDRNRVMIVELPPQTDDNDDQLIIPTSSKDGGIPRFREEHDDLAKSSFTFQIDVGRANLKYHLPAIDHVALTTPRGTYICDKLMKVTQTPGYLNSWSTSCGQWRR